MKRTAVAIAPISALLIWLLLVATVPSLSAVSEVPEVQWERTYGPLEGDAVIQTSDGGYVLTGTEAVYRPASRGPGDWVNHSALLIKTDALGNVQWKKNFTEGYSSLSVIQTDDGGFVLAGPDKAHGAFWLAKTDSNGTVEWSKTYLGGNQWMECMAIQTKDEGYALAGYVKHFGMVNNTAVLVRTDKHGNLLWNRSYSDNGCFFSVAESDDGGFVLLGKIASGLSWLVKTDTIGDVEWNKTYTIYAFDSLISLSKTSDGGYILSGKTSPNGNRPFNALLVKTDSNGNIQWSKTYEIYPNFIRIEEEHGSHPEAYSQWFGNAMQTQNGGYIAAGGLTEGYVYYGSWVLIVKTDANGNLEWHSRYNSTDVNPGNPYQFGDNRLGSIFETNDGGFAFVGTTDYGILLVKFAPEAELSPDNASLTFLTTFVAAAIVVTVIGAGLALLIYLIKRKYQKNAR